MTTRRRLPNRRSNETFSFLWLNILFTATIARISDGAVAEIFLTNGKIDSHADAWRAMRPCPQALRFNSAVRWKPCAAPCCAIRTVLPRARSVARSTAWPPSTGR